MEQKIWVTNRVFSPNDGNYESVLDAVKEKSEYWYEQGWLLHDTCTTTAKNPITGVVLQEVMVTWRRKELPKHMQPLPELMEIKDV